MQFDFYEVRDQRWLDRPSPSEVEMEKSKQSIRAAIGILPLFASFFIPATAHSADNGYHLLARYKLTGHGKTGNIRVDSEARRLYVAHGDRVDVLNADTGASVGILPANGSNDIVLAPDFKHGFISNGTAASVAMFDTATLKVVRTIKLATQNPGAMEYDPEVKRVFVAATGGVAAIDANSGEVVGSVPLEGRLGHLISNDYGRLFVAAEDHDVIHIVDTDALKFLGDFPIGTGTGPSGVALDPSGRRLFVACTNGRLPIIDTDIGFTIEDLPIGNGPTSDVFAFTPQGKGGWKGAVFVASADGTRSLIKMNAFISYSHAGEVKLQPGIQSVAFDSKTHRVFMSASENSAEILVVGQ
jgi:DNA-binding beta-propeller fold protein YncE